MMIHQETGYNMIDTNNNPLPSALPCQEDLQKALSPLILSASGWRKVFAADQTDHSQSQDMLMEDRVLVAAMALAFGRYLQEQSGKGNPCLLLGMDSRPTGPLMGDIMTRVFLHLGLEVRPLFIVAAPEIMAAAGQDSEIDGFCYISASHNPLGHNGVKFGLNQGGVLNGSQAAHLIENYRTLLCHRTELEELCSISIEGSTLKNLYENCRNYKAKSYRQYQEFNKSIALGQAEGSEVMEEIHQGLRKNPLGILGELNGSARGLSIDGALLQDMGVEVELVNQTPRDFVHAIVPEGKSLELCAELLEKKHSHDSAFQLGYVPDCDGDRGNLVYFSPRDGKAKILQAQEVFALSVLSEWCFQIYRGNTEKLAVAVNGPTSLRIDSMAKALGAKVFRAEVGEANVVNLAQEKRDQGWLVPILGEGSNGGNITYPARVRDPLNTLSAMIKLLALRGNEKKQGLFEIWCQRSQQMDKYRADFSLEDILESLPAYCSTSAFESRALMQINSTSHGALKAAYERLFQEEWDEKKDQLQSEWGLYTWREFNQEGTQMKEGIGPEFRSGQEKGGLKIEFYDEGNQPAAYIWMRGSGTEPVFRVMADSRGADPAREAFLLDWQRSLVERADQSIAPGE